MRKEEDAGRCQTLNKAIYLFYDCGMRHVPVCMMFCHWCDVLCRKGDAGIVYMLPMFFVLPLSYFYKLRWLWRLPFLYTLGVLAAHLFYCFQPKGADKYGTYCTMIVLTLLMYAYYGAKWLCCWYVSRRV